MGSNKQKKSESLTALATGVVIGASVAAAGAAILQDKKKREKVKKVANDVKKQVSGYVEDMRKNANDKKEEGKKELKQKAVDSIDSAKGKLEETKKSL